MSAARIPRSFASADRAAGKTYVVQTATYGVPGDAARSRDVKTAVQSLLDNGTTSFEVASLAAGGDPAFGIVKTLTVEYTVDGKPHKASGEDPETIELLAGRDCQRETSGHAHRRRRRRRAAGSLAERPLRAHHGVRPQAGQHGPGSSGRPDRGGSVASEIPGRLSRQPEQTFDTLVAWNLQPDDAVKYFSGTATYSKVITIPAELLGKDRGLYLDLGRVAVMARVKLNGNDLGVLWKAPYRVEIGQFAKAGENTLEIEVTNLWINRMIGDENLPEDSDRNGDGTLKAWPKWLLEGKSSPTGRQSFTSWRLYRKGAPLHESGLLGPVTLQATQRVVPQ